MSTLRDLIDSVEKHAEGPPEMRDRGKWTEAQSLEAIAFMAKEMRALLDANRLAPGAKYALIPDPKRKSS